MNTNGDSPTRDTSARPADAEHQRTVLLVDDEENMISSLKRLLRREGYRILSAGGGAEGLEILATHRVDVIVSDQRMPQMTGVEFLRQVNTMYPDTVRIVLSGYTELQSITDAINEGAIYKFLTKPWDDEQLRANIQEAFRHKELGDENQRLSAELTLVNEQLRRLLAENQRELQRDQVVLGLVQEILQGVPLPVVGLDDEGMIVCANQEADRLLGRQASLIGSFAQERLPPDLLQLLSGGAGEMIWQQGDVCWLARHRFIGDEAAPRGHLLILSKENQT
ncbi:response regulator [Dechloromonas sp. A34]|uniref:response regulator n=1 Tax=Dechloromonas sp. A34 TaxID=447588 RepID=UPI002248F234|nr:response regulator [Dechloromonas sp. A34]